VAIHCSLGWQSWITGKYFGMHDSSMRLHPGGVAFEGVPTREGYLVLVGVFVKEDPPESCWTEIL
jgi:hypothetical protein